MDFWRGLEVSWFLLMWLGEFSHSISALYKHASTQNTLFFPIPQEKKKKSGDIQSEWEKKPNSFRKKKGFLRELMA